MRLLFNQCILIGGFISSLALLPSSSTAESSVSSSNRIEPLEGTTVLRNNGANNKLDVSSLLHIDFNESPTIEVQLFPDGHSVTFHRESDHVDGWTGSNDKDTMKLIRSDGKISGSLIIDDTTYYINTLEDGTAQFERDQAVEDIVESINMMSPERDLSAVVDDCANNEQVAFDLSLTTDQFGHETKWKLADKDGNILLTSFPYEGNMNYMSNSCLDACSCYEFTIYDVGKDGMCCKFGDGGYKLEFDGKEVASGSKFSFKQVHKLGNCQKWYSLGSKCSKKETTATVSSFESSTQTSLPCKHWCSKNEMPWHASEPGGHQKCDWESTCAGCKECQAGFEDLEDLPCKSWCNDVDVPWLSEEDGEEQLCDWKDSCAGCKECSAVAFEDEGESSFEEEYKCKGFFCPFKKFGHYVSSFFVHKKKHSNDTHVNETDTSNVTNSSAVSSNETVTPEENVTDIDSTAVNVTDEIVSTDAPTPCTGNLTISATANVTKVTESKSTTVEEIKGTDSPTIPLSTNPPVSTPIIVVPQASPSSSPIMTPSETNITNVTFSDSQLIDNKEYVQWKNNPSACKMWCRAIKDVPWYSSEIQDFKCSWVEHCFGCEECRDVLVEEINDVFAY